MGVSFHTNFPGGSAHLVRLDPVARRVMVTPAEGPGWKTWWAFELRGLESGSVWEVEVGGGKWSAPERLFYQGTGGPWHRSEPGHMLEGERRLYRVEAVATVVRFAWGAPWGLAEAEALVHEAVATGRAQAWTLCQSREGREVPALSIRTANSMDETGGKPFGVWIMARQHAWESGGSWVAQGVAQWLVSGDPAAETFRAHSEVGIVPIMDVDSVERGTSGKDQPPHDHNRDWGEAAPHWPEVAAARRAILEMEATTGLDLLVDLHQPGPGSRDSYLYITPPEALASAAREKLTRLLAHLQASLNGPLPFVGRTSSRSGGATGRGWAQEQMGKGIAITLEVPWNSPESTPEDYLRLGHRLGMAIAAFAKGETR